MKILINAYACCPNMGSEPGMAWNWCMNLARYCELYIVTEGEFREKIEAVVPTLQQADNMHFYYNPVSQKVRDMCWNQGDWRFYWHYRKWQQTTADIARQICKEVRIDILHQLNMIGFREPGYLWKISRETGIPFVWGPIGGLKQFPIAYAKDAGMKMTMFLWVKNLLNKFQMKYSRRVDLAMRQASVLISSIPDSYFAIKNYKRLESYIISETGTRVAINVCKENRSFSTTDFVILWVGKFDYRKRLDLAMNVVSVIRNSCPNVILKVFGSGTEEQENQIKSLVRNLKIERNIVWQGSKPNDIVQEEMRKAHLFFFTSVNEDTSTVVLEAVSNHLPVLCFDTCGMSAVIDDSVGCKIPLTNPCQSVRDFADRITYLYEHREELKRMSENCPKRAEELSWDNKAKKVVGIYQTLVENHI